MITAFKIVLLTILTSSFLRAYGEKEDKKMRDNMTAICIASIIGSVVAFIMI
ncbi:hypothetical protein P8881_19005 [Bacillus haynesii]|nr:hypothetical protein [Bacillus haynesii]MEC0738769.1 hypothetical protein [Bacillus haynesii]